MQGNKRLKAKLIIKEILEYLPKRKMLNIITYSKEYHDVMGINLNQRKILNVIYQTPFAPLHYTTRFSFQSKHINGFLYNKLLDYYQLIKEQLPNENEDNLKLLYKDYLKSITNNQYLCMIDLVDDEALDLAKEINNLEYGVFLNFTKCDIVKDLTGLNLVYFSGNLEMFQQNNLLDNLLDQLANCPLRKMRINFPENISSEKFSALPHLKKIEITNYWKTCQHLFDALESIRHMGNSIESLTIYSIQIAVDNNKIGILKEKLSNFKNIKHLYLRQTINDKIKYDTFVDIFQSLCNNLLKIKMDIDIFKSDKPITFEEFPNLKKLIIRATDINNNNIFDIRDDIDFQINYSKFAIVSFNLNNINEKISAYELYIDNEAYSEEQMNSIITAISNKNVKVMSFRCPNTESNGLLKKYSNQYLKELDLISFSEPLDLPNILQNNPNITSLKLSDIYNPTDNSEDDYNLCEILFPNNETKIKELELKYVKLVNSENFFTAIKHIKKLTIDNLKLNENDFVYFVNHFKELQELEILKLGVIEYIGNISKMNDYMNLFFESLSEIKGFKHLEFKIDMELDLDYIKALSKNLCYMFNLQFLQINVSEKYNSYDARKLLLQATDGLKYMKTFKLFLNQK